MGSNPALDKSPVFLFFFSPSLLSSKFLGGNCQTITVIQSIMVDECTSSLRSMLDSQLHVEFRFFADMPEARLWFGPLTWSVGPRVNYVIASLYR